MAPHGTGQGTGKGSSSAYGDLPLFSTPATPAAPKPQSQTQTQAQPQQPQHLTVAELTARIRGALEPVLCDVWVKGEVSNFRPAASGHVYFSLKDANACI